MPHVLPIHFWSHADVDCRGYPVRESFHIIATNVFHKQLWKRPRPEDITWLYCRLWDENGDETVSEVRMHSKKSRFGPRLFHSPLFGVSKKTTDYKVRDVTVDETGITFEDPYYKSVQYDATGSIIQLIHENKEEVTFRRLYELLTRDELLTDLVTKSHQPALREKTTRFLALPKTQREEQLSGLLSQIGPFATGEVAPLVNPGSKEVIRLSDALLKPAEQLIYVFLIPTLKYQEIGHQLGKLLLQELGWAVGERASRGQLSRFVPVFCDEFASFVYKGFANILNKARSSQVGLHLSHQSLGDLGAVSDDFAAIVMTNTNTKCIFGLNDPESADYIARHMGTEPQSKFTERAQKVRFFGSLQKTGELSIRQVEAYRVHPNTLKNLTHGRGVLHLPTRLGNLTEELQFAPFGELELERTLHE